MLESTVTRLRRSLATLAVGAMVLQVFLYLAVVFALPDEVMPSWLEGLILGTLPVTVLGLLAMWSVNRRGREVVQTVTTTLRQEVGDLARLRQRTEALQQMATTMSATLSYARVMEMALEASASGFGEQSVPAHAFVGAVFLYDGDTLVPVATLRLASRDAERTLQEAGLVAEAIRLAEPVQTDAPASDPELGRFAAFQDCRTVVCLPLRAAFHIYGVMILGSQTPVTLDESSLEFLRVLSDQTVIALQNAQLHQDLLAEKQRLIDADEEARKELARALHDGPTQSISAIAMQTSFIQSLLRSNPKLALEELAKVEKLARDTAQEVRGMLFTLRPLVLETEGLAAAVEALIKRLQDQTDVRVRLVGGEHGGLLAPNAQGVVFSIVEEALGNARKHARANMIEVRFWKEDGLFVARVQDDGQGFDVDKIMENYSDRGSLGMLNIQERAERVEGSVKLDSRPGRGTAVTLVVPLNANNRREPTHSR